MAKIALNKSELHRQNSRLKTYKKFLPSLELKRKQIIAERNKARELVAQSRDKIDTLYNVVANEYAFLSNTDFVLSDFIEIKDVRFSTENIVGVHLPKLDHYTIDVSEYGSLSAPLWLDGLFMEVKELAFLSIGHMVNEKRLAILEKALQKTTQRVNLFDKVLIPETQDNIRKIKIYLSDFERAAVVQAKIAKGKNEKAEALEKREAA